MSVAQTVIFDSDGTWDVPRYGVVNNLATVKVWGPGGRGGPGDLTDGGGGGGGGAFSQKDVTVTPGQRWQIACNVGADASFGGQVIAKKGADSADTTGAAGGAAASGTGTIKFSGGDGADGREGEGGGGGGSAFATADGDDAAGEVGGNGEGQGGGGRNLGSGSGDGEGGPAGGGGGGGNSDELDEGANGGNGRVTITFTPKESMLVGHWGVGTAAGRGGAPAGLLSHTSRGGQSRTGRGGPLKNR